MILLYKIPALRVASAGMTKNYLLENPGDIIPCDF